MRRARLVGLVLTVFAALQPAGPLAQQAETMIEAADLLCQAPLGDGVNTGRSFCDVLSGRSPGDGIIITLPPHRGPVTLTFDLHNRHTYSEDQIRANRAYTRYTAVVGVLAMHNTLIRRAAVRSEFRRVLDLLDRIGGGAGPGGLKAVAPIGMEHVVVEIPAEETQVSLLGELLTIDRADGSATYSAPGRPMAMVSNVMLAYRPVPSPRP